MLVATISHECIAFIFKYPFLTVYNIQVSLIRERFTYVLLEMD